MFLPASRPTDAFGNVIGDALARGSVSGGAASAKASSDPLGDFIAGNQGAWDQRYANYQQVVGAFSQGADGPVDRSNDMQLAAGLNPRKMPGGFIDLGDGSGRMVAPNGDIILMPDGVVPINISSSPRATSVPVPGSGELSSSAMYAAGYGDIRETVTPMDSNAAETAAELAGRFVKGAVHGAADMVWQPIAQTIDLGQVAYGLFTGGEYQPHWFSAIGQNYEAGMGYGETVTRAVLGSNPVTGVGMASYDLTSSALQGDWGGVAEGAGGMVGGFAAAKYGQRYFAPEPGAQLGFYRQQAAVDVIDPYGMAPTLPGREAANFNSAEPVYLGGRTLNRVFDTVDLDRAVGGAKPNGGYWTEKAYADETSWRTGVAVPEKQPWNKGTLQGEWQPADTWGWGGKAAPQAISKDYSYTKWGFTAGWLQRGGDYQIYVPNPYTVIPAGAIKVSPTPWSKQ